MNSVPVVSGGAYPMVGRPLGVSGGGSGLSGLASLAGLLVGIVAIVVVLAVVGVFVIVVVANRAEPDPSGRRPQSVYLFAISFVTLVTSVIGSATVVTALVQLIGSHPGAPVPGVHTVGDSVARSAVLGGLITLVSLVILIVHLRRGLALARAGTDSTSPSRRVAQSYVSAVAFLTVLVLLVTSVLSVYLLFVIAGPGVFGSLGGRVPALRYLIDTVYVGIVAAVILLTHRNLTPPGLRLWGNGDKAGEMPEAEPAGEPAGSVLPSLPAE